MDTIKLQRITELTQQIEKNQCSIRRYKCAINNFTSETTYLTHQYGRCVGDLDGFLVDTQNLKKIVHIEIDKLEEKNKLLEKEIEVLFK